MKSFIWVFLFIGIAFAFYIAKHCYCGSGCCSAPKSRSCCLGGCCDNSKKTVNKNESQNIKESIKKDYGKVVEEGAGCCLVGGGCCGGGGDLSQYLGYSKEELDAIPEANLGLGCGHPVGLGEFKKGYTVLDLGSGAGIDCFLAAKKVGETGKVIGVDMTEAMINKARENAKKYDFKNVEFKLGEIENLPVEDNFVDIIISNCVINLSTDKLKVFEESFRTLKPGGKMFVSDVVLLGELTEAQRKDTKLISACVGGALLKEDYIGKLEKAGFKVEIIDEDKDICMKWFGHDKLKISSLKFIAHKS